MSKPKTIADILRDAQGTALNSADVCRIFDMSKIGLHKLTKKAAIPHHRVGDRLKFDSIELLEWWERQRVG